MTGLGIVHSLIAMILGGGARGRGKYPLGSNGARVSYRQHGRSGSVVFSKGFKSFEMYYEFGGGDVVACIEVPTAAEWPWRTGFPFEMRQSILEYVGQCVARDQVSLSRGRYEIHADHIVIKAGGGGGEA